MMYRKGGQKMLKVETTNATFVQRHIFHIQLCTLIWSKNIAKVQMVNWETHQPVEEEEEDQEDQERQPKQEKQNKNKPVNIKKVAPKRNNNVLNDLL